MMQHCVSRKFTLRHNYSTTLEVSIAMIWAKRERPIDWLRGGLSGFCASKYALFLDLSGSGMCVHFVTIHWTYVKVCVFSLCVFFLFFIKHDVNINLGVAMHLSLDTCQHLLARTCWGHCTRTSDTKRSLMIFHVPSFSKILWID